MIINFRYRIIICPEDRRLLLDYLLAYATVPKLILIGQVYLGLFVYHMCSLSQIICASEVFWFVVGRMPPKRKSEKV